MNDTPLLMALDQGTTSSRAIVFDLNSNIVSRAQEEFPQHFPHNGWVEHDPEDIWNSTLRSARAALSDAENSGRGRVVAIGITNQRETTLVWDRSNGRPVHRALVWQDRRTADFCEQLKCAGEEAEFSRRTGLLLDPYFSCSKLHWLLNEIPGASARAKKGELVFGTVDSFLISRLSGGAVHLSDATNASRTGLYNIDVGDWDEELLKLFDIPPAMLPEVRDSAGIFGVTEKSLFGREIPIAGVAGDQQAAAVGQCCFAPGEVKSTYGTGCFVLLNTGADIVYSQNKLLSTVALQLKGRRSYALEGSIFIAGAAMQWLRDGLGLLKSAAESEAMARSLDSNEGVYLVPAFTGLGAPHWNPHARGAIFGLTRNTRPEHIVRAALESVSYQSADLFSAMKADGCEIARVRVDGGMVANDWFTQFLADLIGVPVDRPKILETTALGAAYLAGMGAGLYKSLDDLADHWQLQQRFTTAMSIENRQALLDAWQRAVRGVLAY